MSGAEPVLTAEQQQILVKRFATDSGMNLHWSQQYVYYQCLLNVHPQENPDPVYDGTGSLSRNEWLKADLPNEQLLL